MKHTILGLVVALSLLPIAVRAQLAPIFEVQVTLALTVHRGPGSEHLMVGYLEPGMPAQIFQCNADCTWLEMGPNVWIPGDRVTLVQGQLPNGLRLPVPVALALPTEASPAIPTALPPQMPPPAATSTPVPPIPQQVAPIPTVPPPTPNYAPPVSAGCDPNYQGVCVPLVNYGLNCDDIGVDNFSRVGADPHRLDADNDGIACEE